MADATTDATTDASSDTATTGTRAPDGVAAPVVTVTEAAREQILELRAKEDGADGLALRIEVTGVRGVEFSYDLSFDALAERADDDVVDDQGGLPVIVPAASVDQLRGATLDLPSTAGQGGLVLRNPNRPDPLGGGDVELHGTVEEKVTQLLDQRINPALAAHGGFAALDRVEGDTVFVTMGGGCQGCAVSAMTLRDGIARSIKEAIPEVAEVVDLTDHDAGENPFY